MSECVYVAPWSSSDRRDEILGVITCFCGIEMFIVHGVVNDMEQRSL